MKIYIKKGLVIFGLLATVFTFFAFRTDYFEIAKQLEIYSTLFKELNMNYIDEINPAELTETAIDNMLDELDPYTKFYDEQGVEDAKINATGDFSGIGASTKFIDNKFFIYELFKDLPAEKAGIKVGDEIIQVNGLEVKEGNIQEISSLMQGAEGSAIDLQILRQNNKLEFNVERTKIEADPVPHYQMIDDKIGYIAFSRFNSKGSKAIKNAFEDLKDAGMDRLVLDLRDNPGGLLNEAVDITNFFIPKGEVVVTTKGKLTKLSETYRTKNEPIDTEIPIVVLIDRNSASASEIVAGSLQDLDRAVVMGDRSFGKGLVQRYIDLSYGTKLKITISKYYTPSGRNIQELDYTHRSGRDVPKFSEEKRNSFKTKNGRTVYDGGGIEPDIKLSKQKETLSTEALLESDLIFSYVNNYYYSHPSIANPEDFKLTSSDYEDFIKFVSENSSKFKIQSEKIFDAGIVASEKEDYKDFISPEIKSLNQKIQKKKLQELEINKILIMQELSDEIIKRYYFEKGTYQNHLYKSPYVQEAVSLLKDLDRYKKILKP
ncbi:S41 family peptidase [Namhaeicola litoreus]|uniref:S41 family peptidase n=1 Tax=Namhaeicola litoreus TaxID=1052145 RepID=A0ABW3XZD5_9FLAO